MTVPAVSELVRFGLCLPPLIRDEGGFSDDSEDPGGITNLGVTRAAWQEWVGRIVTVGEMRSLTVPVVSPFYRNRYWLRGKSDVLPAGLDYIHFDASVNHGVGHSRPFLQAALGVRPDSNIGPKTLLAIRGCDPTAMVKRYAELREAFYRALPHFPHDGAGWLARLDKVKTRALMWVLTPNSEIHV